MKRWRCCSGALVVAALTAAMIISGGPAARTARAAGPALAVRPPTGHFEVSAGQIYGPNGVQFVPVGTNLNGPYSFFSVPTLGKAQQLQDGWGFNTVRLVTCEPTGCNGTFSVGPNVDLDAIVAEYAAREMVVMIDYQQLSPGARPTQAQINDAIAFWTPLATRYGNNPWVWFNLFNEPESNFNDYAAGQAPSTPAYWWNQHQQVINAIRAAGAENVIVVDDTQVGQGAYEYGNWSMNPVLGSDSGVLTNGRFIVDPLNRVVFSFHAYDVWGYPNDRDFSCANRFTNAQRDAKLSNYVTRARNQGLAVLVGELGYFSTEQETTGVSFHGSFAPAYYPPCGSTQLLAADAVYRIAPGLDLGVLSWHGFDLTTAGPQNWTLNSLTAPTNLTRWGQSHRAYTTYQGGRLPGVPSCGAPTLTSQPFAGTVGQTITQTVEGLGTGVQIRAFFGDGTSSPWVSDGQEISKSYNAPGVYGVAVHVRVNGGATCYQELGQLAEVTVTGGNARTASAPVDEEPAGEGGHPGLETPQTDCGIANPGEVAVSVAAGQRLQDRVSRMGELRRHEVLILFGDGTSTGWVRSMASIDKSWAEPGTYALEAVVRSANCVAVLGTIAQVSVAPSGRRGGDQRRHVTIDVV